LLISGKEFDSRRDAGVIILYGGGNAQADIDVSVARVPQVVQIEARETQRIPEEPPHES
jgi:hypothetical protein